MTKPELEKENKALKAEIRSLRKIAKETVETEDSYKMIGYGVDRNPESGNYRLVKMGFDVQNNSAAILGTKELNKNKMAVAGKARTVLVDEIVKLSRSK